MVCDHCGNENRDGVRFCRFCGQPLNPPVNQMEAVASTEAPAIEQPAGQELAPEVSEAAGPVFTEEQPAVEGSSEEVEPQPGEALAQEELIEEMSSPAEPAAEEVLAQVDSAQPLPFAERYWITGMDTNEQSETVYHAEDRRVCSSCSSFQTDPDPHFCEMCGAELSTWPVVDLVPAVLDGESASIVQIEGRAYQAVEPASRKASLSPAQVKTRCACAWLTDVGTQREINEDSVLALQLTALCQGEAAPDVGFFAVADGIGGYEAGEVASRAAVQALGAAAMQSLLGPLLQGERLSTEELHERVKAVVYAANLRVLGVRHQTGGGSNLGSTVTAVMLNGARAVVANVGDSRVYLMHEGKLSQVSKDQSLVARLVEKGEITREEAKYHPQKNVILNSLGDKPDVELDMLDLDLVVGDRLLLCSDGLWEMLSDDLIEETLLAYHHAQDACRLLVQLANQAGGDDNISVIIISLQTM